MDRHLSLAIIIVSWNVRDLLRRCLQTVVASLEHGSIDYEIVVVDNASADDTPGMLRSEFPWVRLIEAGTNLGFAGGNNLALRALGFGIPQSDVQASASTPPDAVLLLNPDTEPVGDALPLLCAYLLSYSDVVAVGPQLRYADGSVQSSRRRLPDRLTFFWESTPPGQFWPSNPWAQRYHCADRSAEVEQRVDWLVGAALLVRGSAIAQAGLLDERFFMYSEELEWQRRLQHAPMSNAAPASDREQRAGRRLQLSRIAYLPAARIVHHEGKSSEQVVAARHLYFQRSKLRLAQMMYGQRFATLVWLFLVLCYGWEIGAEGIKLLLGHRRALRRQRIEVYAQVLRAGLR